MKQWVLVVFAALVVALAIHFDSWSLALVAALSMAIAVRRRALQNWSAHLHGGQLAIMAIGLPLLGLAAIGVCTLLDDMRVLEMSGEWWLLLLPLIGAMVSIMMVWGWLGARKRPT